MVRAVDRLYRALYRGVLAPLPERTAVALGQWGLRALPLHRLPIWRTRDPRLAIDPRRRAAANPLILSSMYYDTRILRARHVARIRRRHREEHHARAAARPSAPESRPDRDARRPGLVNCNGFNNPGLDAYRRALSRSSASRDASSSPRRASRSRSTSRWSAGLEAFGDLVELNISSPNTQARLRVVDATGRGRAALPGGETGDPEAPHRQGVAGLPPDERGDLSSRPRSTPGSAS